MWFFTEDNFRSTLEMVVKKKDVKQVRIIVKKLMAMGVIDEKLENPYCCVHIALDKLISTRILTLNIS